MSIITPPAPSISTSAAPSNIQPDDLLLMDGLFELVDGRLVEKHMSFRGGKTATKVITILSAFVAEHELGEVVPEVTFKCFPLKPTQGADLISHSSVLRASSMFLPKAMFRSGPIWRSRSSHPATKRMNWITNLKTTNLPASRLFGFSIPA